MTTCTLSLLMRFANYDSSSYDGLERLDAVQRWLYSALGQLCDKVEVGC